MMKRLPVLALCLCAVALCSCGGFGAPKKKKKSSKPDSERTMGQRLDKPNLEKRSRYEKMMTSGGDRNIGSHYQKQMHSYGNFSGNRQAGGMKWHKVDYAAGLGASPYGNDAFSQAGKSSNIGEKAFDTSLNRNATMMSRENKNMASEGSQVFETAPALTRSMSRGKLPKIIENRPTGSGAGEKTYSEDDLKSMLGRP